MTTGEMTMKVPDEIIESHVRAAIAAQLGKDPSALVRAVVDAAMKKKERSYGPTVFRAAVDEMIIREAKAVFAEWLQAQRPKIRTAIRKRLRTKPQQFIETVAEKLVGGMAENFRVSVTLAYAEDE